MATLPKIFESESIDPTNDVTTRQIAILGPAYIDLVCSYTYG